ncbi:MAG: hypothetical protein EBS55_09980 [Flavobacteriaceae bacterium]|nr:hypothetical protein [Flavobacteriaceae bacterium]
MIDNKIIWEVENPNDVSFSSNVVEGHLEEMLHNFLTLAGIVKGYSTSPGVDWRELSQNYCRLSESDVHIVGKDLRNKINQQCDRLNTIKLEDEGQVLTADCYVKDWSIEYPDTEALYFHIVLELTNTHIDWGVESEYVDYDTTSEFLQEFMYNDTSSEQETDLVWPIISVIMEEKNMYDNVYMYSVGLIKYYDSLGNNLLN